MSKMVDSIEKCIDGSHSTSALQRTDEWFVSRRGRLNASELGTALGMNEVFQREGCPSPRELLYTRLRAELAAARGEDVEIPKALDTNTDALVWGTQHEATAVKTYEKITGEVVELVGSVAHPSIELGSWLSASPDGLVGNNGCIEIKCPFSKRDHAPSDSPIYYSHRAQMNLQLEVTRRDWVDYVVWTPFGLSVQRVRANPQLFEGLLVYYQAFYDAASRGDFSPPPLTDADTQKINDLFRTSVSLDRRWGKPVHCGVFVFE